MGSEGEIEWGPNAEEELRAIEAAYAAKRKSSDLEDDPRRHPPAKCRRLPRWATPAVDPGPRDGSSCEPPPPSRGDGLWTLAPPPCRAVPANLEVRYPTMQFKGRVVYCRTTSEVEQATKEVWDKIKVMRQKMDPVSLGFDIEWKPVFRRGEAQRKAAVMQICVDNVNCYVMHIIHSGIPLTLKSLLEDSSSVKVGVAIANDARKILQDYNVSVEPVEDLSSFANIKLSGVPRRWSLSSLTEMLTCKKLAKPQKIRLGNWEEKVLSKEKLQYAATDAYVSWYLYEILKTSSDGKTDDHVEKSSHEDLSTRVPLDQ